MVKSWEALEEKFRRATPASRAQWERGKPVMPGGMIKGAYWSRPYPVYVQRAQGCYLWDLDDRMYVDFANHHTTTVLGHDHPAVVEAIQGELAKGLAFGAPSTLEAEMAEEITTRLPSVEKVRFTNSGTEASLHATRIVRAATGRPKIAKFEGAYHGSHDALEISVAPAEDAAGPADSPTPVPAWSGMASGVEDDVVLLPYGRPESVELILREHQGELAAVFYDAKPGICDIPLDFARFLRELTEELGILMVMDEVVSLRAGYGGYQGIAGVRPDMTILGKAIGGGLPVGAIGGSAGLMDILDNTQGAPEVNQSGTFSGNNLTLAAGLATLRALTPEVHAHLNALRERLHDGLEAAFHRAAVPCHVVGAGSIVTPWLTDRPVRDYRAALSEDSALFERISMGLMLKGHYVQHGLGLSLSAPMDAGHVDGLIDALDEVLDEKDE